jgi:hypothetical protein
MTDFALCVGTAGMSVWFSRDPGQTCDRPSSEFGEVGSMLMLPA